jgi:hypothetical protein
VLKVLQTKCHRGEALTCENLASRDFKVGDRWPDVLARYLLGSADLVPACLSSDCSFGDGDDDDEAIRDGNSFVS